MEKPSKKVRSKDATEILKEIKSGRYRECYLLYNRKSTDDTDNQKNSIAYQKSENARFAFRNGLTIATITLEGFCTDGIVSERHSGFKEDIELAFDGHDAVRYRVERPKFYRLVEWLSKHYVKGVVFLCWDRASRNKGDDTILRKLIKAGVDVRFALAQYDKTSAGELHMDIDGMFAEHHSRVTREKVTLTMRKARESGVWTHKAPVGYGNPGSMKTKPLDPDRAPLIKRLFELAATGEWSLSELAQWAVEHGLTMPPMRRRRTQEEILAEEDDDVRLEIARVSRIPTSNNIHKILINRFYTGKLRNWDGKWIPSASHERLVSDQLFEQVQIRLSTRNQSAHYADFLDHPLRGFVYCASCHRVYSPYERKGSLYYNCRCRAGCKNPNKNISFRYVADKVGILMAKLSFTDEELAEIDARADTDIGLLEVQRVQRIEEASHGKKKIREDLAYLRTNRLPLLRSGAYTPESLVAEESKLNFALSALNEAETVSALSMAEMAKETKKLSELLKTVAVTYYLAKPDEKEKIIRIIFSELTHSENTLDYQCKNGFKPLQNRFSAVGDLSGWLSGITPGEFHQIRQSIQELQIIIT